MSFLLPLALLIGFFSVLPLIAHALRRGKAPAVTFSATRFVPTRASSAKERHHVEDRLLLACRTLLLLLLALLAASPFVKCERLSLARTNGGSLSAAIVLDDSASMRARTSGGASRLEDAIQAAQELLKSATAGDSFSIVLAGAPARILLPPTSELATVTEALDGIQATDRETDLEGALSLAASIQKEAIQENRPVVLLSDLSVPQEQNLELDGVVLPKKTLQQPLKNCAVISATLVSDAVQVDVACSVPEALQGRSLKLIDRDGEPIGNSVSATDGSMRVPFKTKKGEERLPFRAALSESDLSQDQIPEDDVCVILKTPASLTVAVRADQEKAGLKTGAGTVIQAGLEALKLGARVEPLSLLPDQVQDLSTYSVLIIDDPGGFTPEIRDTLSEWVRSGGVALLLLGSNVERVPLGNNYSPFLSAVPSWTRHKSKGGNVQTPGNLGPLTTTWGDLGTKFRAELKPENEMAVKARWDDEAPLIVEKLSGRGLLVTGTLPASVDVSDFALRPAFLELLDYLVSQGAVRRGASASLVGTRWVIPQDSRVTGPSGRPLSNLTSFPSEEKTVAAISVEPDIAGHYLIQDGHDSSTRTAMRHVREHIRQPRTVSGKEIGTSQRATTMDVGISREISLLCLMFGVFELLIRFRRRNRTTSVLRGAA